jgi:hypothetical protein
MKFNILKIKHKNRFHKEYKEENYLDVTDL